MKARGRMKMAGDATMAGGTLQQLVGGDAAIAWGGGNWNNFGLHL